MKKEKGMTFLTLIISIVIIIALISTIVFFLLQMYNQEEFESIRTEMLKIEGRIKVLAESATAKKDEAIKKGTKLSEIEENEKVKEILEKGIISKEEETYQEYYCLNKENLEEIGLGSIELQDGNYIIVNYKTHEVIYTQGIKIEKDEYFKLSELNKLQEEKEILLNEQAVEKEKKAESEQEEQNPKQEEGEQKEQVVQENKEEGEQPIQEDNSSQEGQ